MSRPDPSSRAFALASAGQALWEAGRHGEAVQSVLAAVRGAPGEISLATLALRWIWHAEDGQLGPLMAAWADCVHPGFSVASAEEVMIETFGTHPDRYPLFHCLSSIALRSGAPERAEDLFGYCLRPCGEEDFSSSLIEVSGKYQAGAAAYDHVGHHGQTDRDFLRTVHRQVGEGRDLRIVDAACGSGGLAAGLRPLARWLVGTDLSSNMAEKARPSYDEIIIGDMTEVLKTFDGGMDLVTCCGAAYYLSDIAPFLEASAAALRPGGLLIFSDYVAPETAGLMVTIDGTKRFCRSPSTLLGFARRHGFQTTGYDIRLSYSLPCRIWSFRRESARAAG